VSQRTATVTYIRAQEKHHEKRSFEQEYVAFLKRHNIQVDVRYVWG
jgi:putative transposase